MAMNPYTFANLCEKGILSPADLVIPNDQVVPAMPTGSEYLNMAKQGNLYQSHGTGYDSFHSTYSPAYTPEYHHGVTTGANYNGAVNGVVEVGSKSNAGGMTAFDGYGVGVYNNNNTFTAFGEDGRVGALSQAGGMNAFGGFADTQNNLTSGFNRTMNFIDRIPKTALGFLAGAIGIAGIVMAFKSGKKVPVKEVAENTSFWSKIKPKWLGY